MNHVFLKTLHELSNDIRNAYDTECCDTLPGSSRRSRGKSIRDIDIVDEDLPTFEPELTRKDFLETWQKLVEVLGKQKIFLDSAPVLEGLFVRSVYIDASERKLMNMLIDLMIETVHNHEELHTSDCFTTLVEILGSYCSKWELSARTKYNWNELGHEVDLNISPQDFRNRAYSVLVSLSWVPNSRDLHWICQIEDDVFIEKDTTAPVSHIVASIFHQIRRSSPLPRRDYVNRILSRLKKGPGVTIAIACSSDESEYRNSSHGRGMGKTTLAALVASHSIIRDQYCVLWLSLDKVLSPSKQHRDPNERSYQWYIRCLESLCEQLSTTHEWSRAVFQLESPSLRQKREEEKISQAKEKMRDILQSQRKDILLVLDDACDDQVIESFRFLESQTIIATTNTQNLNIAYTFKVDALTEEEALELFLTESDYPPSHVLSTSLEAKSVVQRCGHHPLTIRTVARWFRLKQVTAGVVKGLEELNSELSECSAKLHHSCGTENIIRFFAEVMNLMLSPVLATDGKPTKLMKVFFSSMAVVFHGRVPLEALYLLWGRLLQTDHSLNELGANLTPTQLRKRIRFVLEALVSLGLLTITTGDNQPYVEIHHPMQIEYALSVLKEIEFTGRYSKEETIQSWNEAFVEAYLCQKVQSDRDATPDICRKYALENLVAYMLQAKMASKAAVLLQDDRFLRDRFDFIGLEEGTKAQVRDCRRLIQMTKNSETLSQTILKIYSKVGDYIRAHASNSSKNDHTAAKGLNCIGLAQAENGFWLEAISMFKDALEILARGKEHPSTSQLSSIILYSRASVHLVNLEPEKCLNDLKECIQLMTKSEETSEDKGMNIIPGLVLLKMGDALLLMHDYKGALEFYQKALDDLYKDPATCSVDIGSALLRKGWLHQILGQPKVAKGVLEHCICSKIELGERSNDLALASSHLGDIYSDEKETAKAIDYYYSAATLYRVNVDEANKADLCLVSGKLHELKGDYDSCVECFDRAIRLLQNALQEREIRTCYDFRCIALIYEKHGDNERAAEAYTLSLAAIKESQKSLEYATTCFFMGEFFIKRGKKDEALEMFEKSLHIRSKKLGACDCVVTTLRKMANSYREMSILGEAEQCVQAILKCTEKMYGNVSIEVAQVLYDLAELKESRKQHAAALPLFRECLGLQKRELGNRDPQAAVTLQRMGAIQGAEGDYAQAYQCYSEAVEIRQAIFPPSDPRIAESLHLMGSVCRRSGDGGRALQFLLRALDIRKGHGYQRQICDTLQEIGHTHRQLQDPKQAIGCYEQCIETLTEAFGDMDEKVGDIYLSLGHAKRDNEETVEALRCYVTALKIQRERNGTNHEKLALPMRSLGVLNFQIGNIDQAMHFLDECINISEMNGMTDALEYVLTLDVLGNIHAAKGNIEDARKVWSMALMIFSNNEDFIAQLPDLGQSLAGRLSRSNDDPAKVGLFGWLTGEVSRGLSAEVDQPGELLPYKEEDVIQKYIFME